MMDKQREDLFQYYVDGVRKCLAGGPFIPLFLYENERQKIQELFPNLVLAKLNTYDDGKSYYVIVRESNK